ncbi:TonB-dependent receptor [Mangrovimicrobium sediminis]|uniref:TonB-dependent receptor n=1 Tax=Mangrovimicrobium sediminis TaxID=2562682 RepID=A0A4Z0LWN8_9GAMM|nr:TonB-dependent receptor [Haliea sp. SAOS-164]TGD71701.1 TonB-dependent receptor [Haliea sp. SAOS-164]
MSATLDIAGSPRCGRKILATAVTSAILASALSVPARAQGIEEVIVTATKRAESVMDVPLAITAISGNTMRDANLDDVKDLIAYSPGITGNSKDSFIDYVSVRGILTNDFGIGGDPSVGIYKNDLYQGRNGAVVTSLYDIERAEVLRGPQGFLFGRGAISGAMSIYTVKPDFDGVHGYAEVDVGERGHLVTEGGINLPVSDSLAFRVAAYHSEEDGYSRNVRDGEKYITHDKDALRLSALFESGDLTVNFMAEYETRDQSGSIYMATGSGEGYDYLSEIYGDFGFPMKDNDLDSDMFLGNRDGGDIYSYGLRIDYDMPFATFSSITGYRDHDFDYAEDFDGLPLIINAYAQEQSGDYFEQEFRLVSNSDGPLNWYAGASFYQEDIEATFSQAMSEDFFCSAYFAYYETTCEDLFAYYKDYAAYYPDGEYVQYFLDYFGTFDWEGSANGAMIDRNRAHGKYKGYAAYIDLSYDFNEQWDASVGVRYTYDEKDFSNLVLPSNSPVLGTRAALGFTTPQGPVKASDDWDEITPRAILNYHPSDDTLVFASVTWGYKSGGFNTFGLTPPAEFGITEAVSPEYRPAGFDPENSLSYEIGYKGVLGDSTRITANAFYYEYEDLQASYYDGALFYAENVGQVDGWGFEGTLTQNLGEYLDLNLGLAWFDSEGKDVQKICGNTDDCEGAAIPWAPEWSGFATLDAHTEFMDGELFGLLAYNFQTEQYGGWEPNSQELDGWGELQFTAGYRGERWSLAAYVDNVTDEYYYDGVSNGDSVYPAHFFGPSRPRTFGVKVGFSTD